MTPPEEPRLQYTDVDGTRCEIPLSPAGERYTLGRSTHADVSFPGDSEVSRLHAAVEWMSGHWTIVDDGLSRNGTYVGGDRLTGRRRLRHGDTIRIGSSLLTFHDLAGVGDEATRIAAEMPSSRSLTDTQRGVLVALCRPYKHNATFANPSSNQQIAGELFLSVDAVKTHLRVLFAKFGVEDLPQNVKRVRLAERALQSGVISQRDL
ncbi:FHA domain-containing protein [Rhodococcus sp. P1Y]|uniref:FHA domain-containing protein n=1 Tax=Rhodococcus sp. P1Y TaxID=1302308 RepID=UPI000EB4C726|nr:FHA domain-containing protein [Rhodococcus sp. P1Y]AYJ48634.1 FHA domain-containing protein [Rhodococcus sp. P1Y]